MNDQLRNPHKAATTFEEDGFEAPCWCGEMQAWFSDLQPGCAGTGYVDCLCGGDFCVCHNHGGCECPGCEDCGDYTSEAQRPWEYDNA